VSSRSILIAPTGNRTHDSSQVQPVVQSLYRLSYPSYYIYILKKNFHYIYIYIYIYIYTHTHTHTHRSIFICFFYGSTTLVDLVISSAEVSRSHTAIPHSVGILQTSDRPVAESYTCDHKTHTRRPSIRRRDSNPQSQQASGRRPTP
jgi:hypothetical protein